MLIASHPSPASPSPIALHAHAPLSTLAFCLELSVGRLVSSKVDLASEFGKPIYYASSLVRVARHVAEAGGRALVADLMSKVIAKSPLSNLLFVRNRDDALAYQALCTQRRLNLRYTVVGYDDGFVLHSGGYIGGSGGKKLTKLDQLPRVNRWPHPRLAVRMVEPEDTRGKHTSGP